jgi:hypothetical protein
LLADVTDGNSGETGNAQLVRDLAEYFVEGAATTGVVGALHARAERDRLAAVERAREPELLEHPVDAVHRLVDVLENEDAIAQVGRERRAAQGREHGEIAPDEPSFGDSRVDLARVGRDAAGVALLDDRAPQRVTREVGERFTCGGTVVGHESAFPLHRRV